MIQRCSRSLAMIFENHDVLETPVLLEIKDAVTKRPEYVFHPLHRHGSRVSM